MNWVTGLPVFALYDPADDAGIAERMEAMGISESVPLPLDAELLERRLEGLLSR